MEKEQEISRLSPIKAIRLHCLECLGNSSQEVERCSRPKCPLWSFRLGKHPTFKMSPAEKVRRSEHGKNMALNFKKASKTPKL